MLLSRFRRFPLLTGEILTAGLFISLLNLALPIYVIQLLNRFIGHGFEGTLYTLTCGVLIAIVLQYGFRTLRTSLLAVMNAGPDRALNERVMRALNHIRFDAVAGLPREKPGEVMTEIRTIQAGWEPANLVPLLDVPFALLYLAALAFLSPLLAWIALAGSLTGLAAGSYSTLANTRLANRLAEMFTTYRMHELKALSAPETVRAFNGETLLEVRRNRLLPLLSDLQLRLARRREKGQSFVTSIGALQSVLVYSAGAVLVVRGDINVGILIGANILAGRAFQSVAQLFRSIHLLRQAARSMTSLERLTRLPAERREGVEIPGYRGGLALHDLSFTWPGGSSPLFESLSLTLEPGAILVVTGSNGSGKTTFIRLLAGLLESGRGDILADGINLRQVGMDWWRRQLIYLPQEPDFLAGSILDNLTLNRPVDETRLTGALQAAALRDYLDRAPDGIETIITDTSRIPPGIRKRIALARSLMTDGPLVLFDEPTEALDREGCAAVYELLNRMARRGKTMVICGNDPQIVKAATLLLDLNRKPVPRITTSHDSE
ncbi:MAG: hypothetical protein Kow0089_06190 [Desulfobulbaceae bacterium]